MERKTKRHHILSHRHEVSAELRGTPTAWRKEKQRYSEYLIVIGASTGGTEALKQILSVMPITSPGVLIVQHMPEKFIPLFVQQLNKNCAIHVKQAEHGEKVLMGHAYIAPGDAHLLVTIEKGHFVCKLSKEHPVNRHRPSVDVLFSSVAACAGKHAFGIILTGMGKDGASGLLAMKQSGSYNFAQDEASCAVFGMPKEAIHLGAVDEIVPLEAMASRLLQRLPKPLRKKL